MKHYYSVIICLSTIKLCAGVVTPFNLFFQSVIFLLSGTNLITNQYNDNIFEI